MKTLLSSITLILLTTNLNAANLVSAKSYKTQDGQMKTLLLGGLAEDGFNGPSAVCFVGQKNDVCQEVRRQVKHIEHQYALGAHGKIILNNCKIEKEKVVIQYTRDTDYDSVKDSSSYVNLIITNCN